LAREGGEVSEGNSIIRLSSIVLGEIPTLLSSHHSRGAVSSERGEKGERIEREGGRAGLTLW
jgi:hypothetical protein